MTRQITRSLRAMLTIALAVGMMLSANARSIPHDTMELAKLVAERHAEIEEHGHSHEDIVDVMHAYRGHSHEIADHDQNIAYLPPREASETLLPTSTNWAMSDRAMRERRDDGLDRPPRV